MAEEDDVAAVAPKSKTPLIMGLVGLLGLGGGGAMLLMSGKSDKAHAKKGGESADEAEGGEEEGAEEADAGGDGVIVKIDPFVSNLESDDGEMHYLKFTLQLEVPSPEAQAKLDKRVARIRHEVLLALSGLKVTDALGPENKKKLQATLQEQIRKAAGRGVVRKVYLTEYLVQ